MSVQRELVRAIRPARSPGPTPVAIRPLASARTWSLNWRAVTSDHWFAASRLRSTTASGVRIARSAMTSVRVAVVGISTMAGMLNSRTGPPAISTLVSRSSWTLSRVIKLTGLGWPGWGRMICLLLVYGGKPEPPQVRVVPALRVSILGYLRLPGAVENARRAADRVLQRVLVGLLRDERVTVSHRVRDLLDRQPLVGQEAAERVPASVTRPPAEPGLLGRRREPVRRRVPVERPAGRAG